MDANIEGGGKMWRTEGDNVLYCKCKHLVRCVDKRV